MKSNQYQNYTGYTKYKKVGIEFHGYSFKSAIFPNTRVSMSELL